VASLSAALWLALAYAVLRRFLVRRTFIFLAALALIDILLSVSNGVHHWIWTGFFMEQGVRPLRGPLGQFFVAYGSALAALSLLVFVWLFVRSPLHRLAVGFCILGQVGARFGYLLQEWHPVSGPHVDFKMVGLACMHTMYALALFRFKMFNLIPIARGTLVEQMREGMLVLDPRQRIVDLNPAAERILNVPVERARGFDAFAVLPFLHTLRERLVSAESVDMEGSTGTGEAARFYVAHVSALTDWRGQPLGHLVLLRETTEEKHAQQQAVAQERALATLRERDRVARELHDGLGQLLGFVKFQAEAARGLLRRGQHDHADRCLAQLAAVAQDAHGDVREYIVGARAGMDAGAGLAAALETYVRRFNDSFGIATTLEVAPELARQAFDPMVEAQLLRIIQESLTNVRKHARARRAAISLSFRDGRAEATVRDDGAGFDPAQLDANAGKSFGLRIMKERAEEVGGEIRVVSAPGEGCQITISVPLRKDPR
jgi:signal transduction histidine kinase